MAFTLIIKGNEEEARDALFVRGIEWGSIKQHEKFNECIVLASAKTEWAKLASWFCEDRDRRDTLLGFPAGTLLWYGPYTVPYTIQTDVPPAPPRHELRTRHAR